MLWDAVRGRHLGQDCISVGLAAGTLACDGSCQFDTTGCVGPPTVPALRKPMNASYLGNVHVTDSLRPGFEWDPSFVGGGASITYELEVKQGGAVVATLTGISGNAALAPLALEDGKTFTWRVRATAGLAIKFQISGGTGDADMYTRQGARPTTSTYSCRPYLNGNNETCNVTASAATDYYVMLRGYTSYSGVQLIATW